MKSVLEDVIREIENDFKPACFIVSNIFEDEERWVLLLTGYALFITYDLHLYNLQISCPY